MCPDRNGWICLVLGLVLVTSTDAFFFKWGSDHRQVPAQKTWIQPISQNIPSSYRYQQYLYSPYESRKVYQIQNPHPQYSQPEVPIQQVQQSMAPIPISIPAGSSLTPVSLQHVQLVPCMCPVAPEEAEKLQEQVGPGPYLAQTYPQSTYVPQDIPVSTDNKVANKV